MKVNNNYITIDEYNEALHIVNTYKKQQEQKNALPQFVLLNGTSMRLNKIDYGEGSFCNIDLRLEYWRDNGCWGVGIIQRGNRVYSISDIDYLDNVLLIPITEEEYNKENI